MKFGVCKFAFLSVLASVGVLALIGCGSSNNLNLTQGNWSVTATSTGGAGTYYIGGNLTQSGSTLSGSMYVISSCINSSQAIAFTGTVNGKTVTLTSPSASGQVIAVTATGTAGALTGSYTVTGGCADGDKGTITASSVPSISANWSGPISGSGGPSVSIAIAFTQATAASSDGTFGLTGNVTFTNSSCSLTGTINSSFIAGPYLVVNGQTNEVGGGTGDFTYTQVLLNNAATPTSMKGTYTVIDGNCGGDLDSPTLTKQ
jgi:hypothetical protein